MKYKTILASLAIAGSLQAGPSAPVAPSVALPPPVAPSDDLWHFRAAPYGWLSAIDGDISIGRLSAPVDISISDTLDSLDMAYMGVFGVSYGKWSLDTDVIYAKTSSDIQAGGILFDSFRYEQKEWIITPTLGYRVIDNGSYHMDVFAGARFTVMEADLVGRFEHGGQTNAYKDTSWADPIIGIRGQANFNSQWFFRYNGDIGGFGVNSDLVWQAFAGFGYNFNQYCSVALGYRGLGIDYSKDNFAMDTTTHGPVIGLEIHW